MKLTLELIMIERNNEILSDKSDSKSYTAYDNKVENILKGSLDFSENSNYGQESLFEV